MESFFSTKANRLLGSLVLLMSIIALGAYAHYAFELADRTDLGPSTITVSGEGEVLAIPDIGQFSFSVSAEGEDASAAQEASATKINAIISSLKDEGVEEKDIKTQNYNMNPKYKYEQRNCVAGSFCPPGERVQDGFQVTQTVRVKVRNLDESGKLISGVGDLGATNISSLAFTIDDTSVLENEAKSLAIKDAKAKAKALASELGVSIDDIVGFYENGRGESDFYDYGGNEARSVALFDSAAPPQIPVGENTIRSQVSITYKVE